MAQITLVGIDLAKSVFQVHGVNRRGQALLRRRFTRKRLVTWLGNLAPCTVAMEACAGAHYWARVCARHGHKVKLIAPQFVKPFVKTNKSDSHDAEGIVEAASRPSMRYVAPKDEEQQVLQALHRVRSQLVGQRTAVGNQVRALLLEFGIPVPRGVGALRRRLPALLEDADNGLPERLRRLIAQQWQRWLTLVSEEQAYKRDLEEYARQDERCRRLLSIPGIGPITATALVAAVGDVRCFRSGRELAAWLGLVPRWEGTGGRTRLLGISKRGDTHLRTLMIHGARSSLRRAANQTDRRSRWALGVEQRRGRNIASVALANKNARTAWALLRYNQTYQSQATAT